MSGNMYINIDINRIHGCLEYKQTGDVSVESNQSENGAWLFADDLEALDTISFKHELLYPQKLRTVGYADVGGQTLIFMYGVDDCHGVEIAAIDDNYFLACFQSGMTRDEIVDELTGMIMEEFARCDGIRLDDIDIDELQYSFDHPIRIVDEHLNNGEFRKSECEQAIGHEQLSLTEQISSAQDEKQESTETKDVSHQQEL